MSDHRIRNRVLASGVALALLSGTSLGFLAYTNGSVATAETSAGAATFTQTIFINTVAPVAAPQPNGTSDGFGDSVLAVEEGRDDRGPFCAIVMRHGPNSPHNGTFQWHQCYPFGQLSMFGPPVQPDPPPFVDCSIGEAYNDIRYVYRPTNDPANPGWTSLPGSAGQIEDGIAACHAVAESIRKYLADVTVPPAPPPPAPPPPAALPTSARSMPMIRIEIDPNPANVTYREFYKFKIQTISSP